MINLPSAVRWPEPWPRAIREGAIWDGKIPLDGRRETHKSVVKLIIPRVVCHQANRDNQSEQRECECECGGMTTSEDCCGDSSSDWQERKQLETDVSEHTEIARHFPVLRKKRIATVVGHSTDLPSAP